MPEFSHKNFNNVTIFWRNSSGPRQAPGPFPFRNGFAMADTSKVHDATTRLLGLWESREDARRDRHPPDPPAGRRPAVGDLERQETAARSWRTQRTRGAPRRAPARPR